MSSAAPGDPEGAKTAAWEAFRRSWVTSAAVRILNDELAREIERAVTGIDNDGLEATAVRVLGHLAADQPRCIHETTHHGPGYRAEWQHWVADRLQSVKRHGRARYDRGSKLWFPAMTEELHFVPGENYLRKEIHDRFGGQEQGGISTPAGGRIVFLFTGEEGQAYGYDDGFQPDGSFRYFGEGQVGDMSLTRGNLAVRNHSVDGRDLHLFKSRPDGQVEYVGQMVCAAVEELANVPDRDGHPRLGIAFRLVPLEQLDEGHPPTGPKESVSLGIESSRLWSLTLEDLRREALGPPETTQGPAKATRTVYRRSSSVKVYVQRRAKGHCEGCGSPAPFKTTSGRPYLEPHHTRRLSDGGPDHPMWVVAVCPTCHRRAHYSEDHASYNLKLQKKANSLEGLSEGE